MSWSWSWLKEVLVTLLELILAIAEVVWKWLCEWTPVLLVVDLVGHSFAVVFFFGRSSLLFIFSSPLLTVYQSPGSSYPATPCPALSFLSAPTTATLPSPFWVFSFAFSS